MEVAKLLEDKYKNRDVLVLGIPRGGVVIAYEIAKAIHGGCDVVITKKLPHPLQEERAIGAVAEDGSIYLTSLSKGIDQGEIHKIAKAQEQEIQNRIRRFREGRPLPEMFNRIVIIADDGIATGSTIIPAIKLCKQQKAAKVIVAVPVSSERYASTIGNLADEVVIAEQPESFFAVEQVYAEFHSMADEEVTGLLREFRRGG